MQGVVIAGTHSGCGKTTITLGILAALKKKNIDVRPFKAGPDFIDTGLHSLITGRTSRNLDLWMCGGDYVKECFDKHSADADISVIEGVMGMYDGSLSTADLAAALDLPVILVVDAYGMAESAGAVVKGFKEYGSGEAGKRGSAKAEKKDNKYFRADFAGVIFNRVASDRHYKRLKDSVQGVPVLGYLPRSLDFKIPERHLGLVVAEENPIDEKEIGKLADAILAHIDIDSIVRKCRRSEEQKRGSGKAGKRGSKRTSKIGIAYDKAFCFYYEDNLDLLNAAGAEIVRFSPLSDSRVPDDVDALYMGGGYPELYAEQLSKNKSMLVSIRKCAEDGMPVYAECGGFMYLTEGIYDLENKVYPMSGVFPLKTRMTKKRARLGYRETVFIDDSILGKKDEVIRGHEFHYSEIAEKQESNEPLTSALPRFRASELYSVKDGTGSYIYNEGCRLNNAFGSYIHIHFGSNPQIADNFLNFIKTVRNTLAG
jgi:cobyrinic acid a,c-diamide synthase